MRIALVLSLVVAAACTAPSLPTREADIVGLITRISDDGRTILVEERPQETSGSAKASILVTDKTRVWRLGLPPKIAAPADLRVGLTVRAWFDGPVETSYPLGAIGGDVAIDPAANDASLYVVSKGAPAVVVRVNGFAAAHVACNGGSAIRPRADGTPELPWDVVVARESDGQVLFSGHVAELPRWLLVQPGSFGVSTAPVSGPLVPCP